MVAHVIIVSAQSKELGFWVFKTWSDLRVRILGMLGQGIGDLDLDLGLTKVIFDKPRVTLSLTKSNFQLSK